MMALIEPGDEVVLFQAALLDGLCCRWCARRRRAALRAARAAALAFLRGNAGRGYFRSEPRSCCSTTRSIIGHGLYRQDLALLARFASA